MIKTLNNLGIEALCLNIIKAVYESPEGNLLSGEKLNCLPLRSGAGRGNPTLLLLFNIVLEILARAIRQEEEIKDIQIGIEVKLSLLTDDMILYAEMFRVHEKNC